MGWDICGSTGRGAAVTAVAREREGCDAVGRGVVVGTVCSFTLVAAGVVEGTLGVAEGRFVELADFTTATSQWNEGDGGARPIFAISRPARMMAVPCSPSEMIQQLARWRTNVSCPTGWWAVTGGRPPG